MVSFGGTTAVATENTGSGELPRGSHCQKTYHKKFNTRRRQEDANRNHHFLKLCLIEWGPGWAHEEVAGVGVGLGIGGCLFPSKMTLAALENASLLSLPLADHNLSRSPASPTRICPSWLFLCWDCSGLFLEAWENAVEF